MNRLQAELQRLFPSAAPAGSTQVLVLQAAGPEAWGALGQAWQGVQADLQLPAPAIAVAGNDGYQLWFSLAQPVPVGQAWHFLSALRRRYVGDTRAHRIVMAPAEGGAQAFPRLPPRELGQDRWSAFVTADLAGLFSEEAWLDLCPSPDAQAELLSRLAVIQPAQWQQALQQLGSAPAPDAAPAARQPEDSATSAARQEDPRQFLLEVMNDASVELALRIEAAKALLPYSGR